MLPSEPFVHYLQNSETIFCTQDSGSLMPTVELTFEIFPDSAAHQPTV